VTLVAWAKIPRSGSINRDLRCVKPRVVQYPEAGLRVEAIDPAPPLSNNWPAGSNETPTQRGNPNNPKGVLNL
jgi:hypothetical protein